MGEGGCHLTYSLCLGEGVQFESNVPPPGTTDMDEQCLLIVSFLKQFELEKVDITLPENKEWYKKYRYDIPVFHLNGQYLMKHRADLKVFQRKITDMEKTNG